MLGEMCTAQKCTAATIGARTQGMNGRSAVQEHLGHFEDESFQSVTVRPCALAASWLGRRDKQVAQVRLPVAALPC